MLLFLFAQTLTLGVGGCINVGAYKQFDEMVAGQGVDTQVARQFANSTKSDALKTVTRMIDASVESIADVPIVLLLVFFVTTLMLPLLIALMGFDQISAEIGPKSIRYSLLRAQRGSVLLGKYASQATELAVLVSVAAMVGVTHALNADFGWGEMFVWGARLWVVALIMRLFLNIILLFSFWLVSLVSNLLVLPGSTGSSVRKNAAGVRAPPASQQLRVADVEHQCSRVGQRAGGLRRLTLLFPGAASVVLERKDV